MTTQLLSIETQCKKAKRASASLLTIDTDQKNMILVEMAKALQDSIESIIAENKKDIAFGIENNLSKSLIDRLTLNEERINDIAKACLL